MFHVVQKERFALKQAFTDLAHFCSRELNVLDEYANSQTLKNSVELRKVKRNSFGCPAKINYRQVTENITIRKISKQTRDTYTYYSHDKEDA